LGGKIEENMGMGKIGQKVWGGLEAKKQQTVGV